MTKTLEDMVRLAWSTGNQLDLTGVVFGPSLPEWNRETYINNAFPYYHFLAGFVRTQQCSRILEIGTHFGGSSLAMLRGVPESSEARVLTLDITDLNPALHHTHGLTKLTGNANRKEIIQQTARHFSGVRADLIYIDTNHSYLTTALTLGVYGMLLRPRFIIMDDINLNDDMVAIWSRLREIYSESVNCIEIVPDIRSVECGFGLIKFDV